MKRIWCSFIFIGLLASPAAAQDDMMEIPDAATSTPLSEDELTRVFTDQTHRGTYNFQRKDVNTFSFTERTTKDGRTRHVHGDKVDTGDWRIGGDLICFNYETAVNFGACFHIYQQGNCYYHYVLDRNAPNGGRFTARTVIAGERPSCEPSMS
ncbi:hypothetical protein ACJ3XI_04930 [Litorimonas sp. RW-G-Af-16]|uniref:hypothetical protein n=1 Tax=Litorimonas sp. RW-G-Af-16 TaxID=3241168 RepID=UPI00390CAB63